MKGKLLSFTNVTVPPPPYNTATKSGIFEDEEGNRHIVRIENEYYDLLEVGMKGEIEERETDFGTFKFFIPDVEIEEEEKVAIVTGASRGIGGAIALELAKNEFNVVISDIEKTEQCEENMNNISELGREAIFIKTDVTDRDQVKEMVDKTIDE
ncbi:MAG: SDR family NAD(P)-dependent oxidoreductase, partial [Hadesarchaea archaeon]|nr:SDR family NAD(P)-dependent oxidoreductase [Hadesarchaea archaeon]